MNAFSAAKGTGLSSAVEAARPRMWAVLVLAVTLLLCAGKAIAQEADALFDPQEFEIVNTTICNRPDRIIYRLEGPLDTFQVDIEDKSACGIAYSYKDERNDDIFIFGVVYRNDDSKEVALQNYAKAVAGRFLKASGFELSADDEVKAGPFLRQKYLIKPANSFEAQWGVIDVSFRSLSGGGAVVIFVIGPYAAWFPDKLGEIHMDADLQAALTSTRAALDVWFGRNQSLIFDKWNGSSSPPPPETPVGNPAANPQEKPAEISPEKTAGTPPQKQSQQPEENTPTPTAQQPLEKAVQRLIDTPVNMPAGVSPEMPAGTPANIDNAPAPQQQQ